MGIESVESWYRLLTLLSDRDNDQQTLGIAEPLTYYINTLSFAVLKIKSRVKTSIMSLGEKDNEKDTRII